jgi:hypothetical protein
VCVIVWLCVCVCGCVCGSVERGCVERGRRGRTQVTHALVVLARPHTVAEGLIRQEEEAAGGGGMDPSQECPVLVPVAHLHPQA